MTLVSVIFFLCPQFFSLSNNKFSVTVVAWINRLILLKLLTQGYAPFRILFAIFEPTALFQRVSDGPWRCYPCMKNQIFTPYQILNTCISYIRLALMFSLEDFQGLAAAEELRGNCCQAQPQLNSTSISIEAEIALSPVSDKPPGYLATRSPGHP